MEALAKERGQKFSELELTEKDALWNEIKEREKCVSEIWTGNARDCSTGKDERPSDQNPSGRYQQRHRRLLYGG